VAFSFGLANERTLSRIRMNHNQSERGIMSSKKFVVGLLFGISAFSLAGAAIPEPPSPLANINLTFDQRLEQMKQTDSALLKATPEERKEYWHKMRDQMKALSPEDRKLVHEKMKAQWQSITPEQKERMKAERKTFFDGLTPEEQAEMKARKAKWENMSPEERQKWHKQSS
jgi:Skp family chaperone for outer membrane proteins